jgi:predicted dehydrogenase
MISQKNNINYGIIGFGRYAENRLVPAFRKTKYCFLYSLSKRKEQAAYEKALQYDIPKYYSNINLLLSRLLNLVNM